MSSDSKLFSIGEVARKTGVESSALRYYESVGILPVPQRVSGKRVYGTEIFKQIRLIRAAQQSKFSLAEIQSLLQPVESEASYSERLQELAQRKLAEIEQLIADAEAIKCVLQAGLNCQCAKMEDCLLFLSDEE